MQTTDASSTRRSRLPALLAIVPLACVVLHAAAQTTARPAVPAPTAAATRAAGATGRLRPLPATAALFAAHCSGCHGAQGRSVGEIPTLAGRIGYFTRLPAGRAYLVQVPGVALSTISDAEVADVLNWVLRSYSREQLAADFVPYGRDEVAALRRERINPWAVRAQVVRALADSGLIPSDDALAIEPLRLY